MSTPEPPTASKFGQLRAWAQQQLRAIDREHQVESLPDGKAAWILVTAALALVIPRYFGTPSAFSRAEWLVSAFSGFPYPDLHPHLYWCFFKLLHYGVLPYLCIRFVLRRRLRDHGFHFTWEPKVWLLYLGMLAIVLPLTALAARTDSFLATYPKYPNAGQSLPQLLIWDLAYAFQFLMIEFFFRGFLIFSLARYVGSLAIFIMVIPYAMIHLNKPLLECLGSIITGIVLGTVALRTRSIYGGVVVHSAVAWAMDLFAIAQKGQIHNLF
ncbi:MAG TPA: CPBP family intramembrane glutamic endopeptidase [Polyangiaceae bacterium]|nr:CPBP family intramembrane glutamic endopeptidase [Polyangiaceae bacterium]